MQKKGQSSFAKRYNIKWVFFIIFWTLILSTFISLGTESIVQRLHISIALIFLIFIVVIGIIFDILGIAVATADEKPFHAMASNRVPEAKIALRFIKNAGQVSNFCNDVIGDICGIVSGGTGAVIVFKIVSSFDIIHSTIVSVLLTSLIAAFTVGGKAFGKSYAMENSNEIVFKMAKFIFIFRRKKT